MHARETATGRNHSTPDEAGHTAEGGLWKILVADTREDVHNVTRLVLEDFTFEGRRVECLSAYSSAEAKQLVLDNPDAAVLLLDVVLETPRAGLEVAEFIRSEARNRFIRIIVRTGEAGEAPESEIVTKLDINDYRHKAELTADRLVTAVTTAIRSYRDLHTIEEGRYGLHLLAMSVAHQIRNRTVVIAGYANLLKKKMAETSDVGELLETILHESSRLESMVSDVTRYASLEIGELRFTGIRGLLEEAMDRVETVDGGEVSWEVLCPDQPVLVDPDLTVTAFTAILQNGVDFSNGDPKVRVHVSPGQLACVVDVEDYGLGIEESELPHIFDPFYSTKSSGAGMGLSIVRKIATDHQWDVSVSSVPEQGTTVRVVIPRRELTGLR